MQTEEKYDIINGKVQAEKPNTKYSHPKGREELKLLLTITYEGQNTQDLGYLLYKHPDRAQQFDLSYGKAYVFYPEVSDERTTAALLLDMDPIDLARGKLGSRDGGLFDYVNDRPYTSTSFLSTAISRVFGTAMNGRCDARQELANTPIPLTAQLSSLKDGGEDALAKQLFEPLGYTVATKRTLLDEKFPEWGESPYIDLTIRGTVRLCELLNHIYVLIPVFDRQKHYYTSEAEIRKLLDHGEGWLATHPYKEKIARRYFSAKWSYARRAINILLSDGAEEDGAEEDVEENVQENIEEMLEKEAAENEALDMADNKVPTDNKIPLETKHADNTESIILMTEDNTDTAEQNNTDTAEQSSAASKPSPAPHKKNAPLNTLRLSAVRDAVLASGATSVIDLGCGECRLTSLLLNEPQIRKITACDVSTQELEKAARHLRLDRMQPGRRNKLTLMQASLTYKDDRFAGFDCACVIEVVEHIEPMRLPAVERILFEFAAPKTVILTTPNCEYNANYEAMQENNLRHDDHRFEWTRAQFKAWCEQICTRFGYRCEIRGIGNYDEKYGNPTQMGVFTKNGTV